MSKFNNILPTVDGQAMLIESLNTSTPLIFTSVQLGDGVVSSSDNVINFKALKHKCLECTINEIDKTKASSGTCVITAVMDNTMVDTGFFAREIGVFAKVDTSGTAKLFGYADATYADYMPPKTEVAINNNTFEITIVFGSSANITAVISNSQYATLANLDAHNKNASAHSNLSLTVNDTHNQTTNTDTLTNLMSGLARQIKTANGTTDWKTDPATNLASISTLFGKFASGSDVTWSGKKFTNEKLGITGLIDTNGYISLGPNYGGLIIQWIKSNINSGVKSIDVVPQLSMSMLLFCTITHIDLDESFTYGDVSIPLSVYSPSASKIVVYKDTRDSTINISAPDFYLIMAGI